MPLDTRHHNYVNFLTIFFFNAVCTSPFNVEYLHFSLLHLPHLSHDMSSLQCFVTFTVLHTTALNMGGGSWCKAHVSYSFPLKTCVHVCSISVVMYYTSALCSYCCLFMNYIMKLCISSSCDNCVNYYRPVGCCTLDHVVCQKMYCLTG